MIYSPSRKCPDEKQRLHLETNTCHRTGAAGGPCGENMIFYPNNEKDSIYGTCDCSEVHEVPLVFHLETEKCYPIYERVSAYTLQIKPPPYLIFDTRS
jgi:hypothetical protein